MVLVEILGKFYKYNWVKNIKDCCLRPIKHFVFGKDNIYLVMDEIKKGRRGQRPIEVIFDVGAAIGEKTFAFLKEFPGATIYCFEPQQDRLNQLKSRLKKNQKVKLLNFGLWNKEDNLEFHIISHRDASSLLPMPKYLKMQSQEEVGMETIKVKPLDAVIKKIGINRIDFIKIDVEGAELEVLRGGMETFKNKIDNVFIEIDAWRHPIHSEHFIEIFKFMHEAGFTFLGAYGDYFFSKDENILKNYFDRPPS